MALTLKPYQENAVHKMVSEAQRLLVNTEEKRKEIVFRSPTGSGKTIMVAKFVERLIEESQDDLCFVWGSIGKGELHLQSKRKLERMFVGFPPCELVEEQVTGSRDMIGRNEVWFVNWEKLRLKEKKSGEWTNILMRDGEKINFREVLANTNRQRKIIVIVDESHVGGDTKRSVELYAELDPEIILSVSATPNNIPGQEAYHRAAFVDIRPEEVIKDGMIKKEIIINERLDHIRSDDDTSQGVVLEAANQKRLELLAAFQEAGVAINPLVLVQIPNKEEGEAKRKAVEAFLAKKGITEANGKFAIKLERYESAAFAGIDDPLSKVEFLIFKQAIDTGWDCPRAHILVKFREISSETFEIQTVGRILRMPEQKHYLNEVLNRGYIYTNVTSIQVKKEEYNPNIIKHVKAQRCSDYQPISLRTYSQTRSYYGHLDRDFIRIFGEVASAKLRAGAPLNLDYSPLRHGLVQDASIKSELLDKEKRYAVSGEKIEKVASHDETQALFEHLLKRNAGAFSLKQSLDGMKKAVWQWCHKHLDSQDWPDEVASIQRVFVRNYENFFQAALVDAVEQARQLRRKKAKGTQRETEGFELKPDQYYNSETTVQVSQPKHVFQPCYLDKSRSMPEQEFESFLARYSDQIVWWWKNGEQSSEYFGIQYEYKDDFHASYPDYLVQFKDGRLGIFETKDANDQEKETFTKSKAEALRRYIELENSRGKNLWGGIAIQFKGVWKLNAQPVYQGNDFSKDWEDLRL